MGQAVEQALQQAEDMGLELAGELGEEGWGRFAADACSCRT